MRSPEWFIALGNICTLPHVHTTKKLPILMTLKTHSPILTQIFPSWCVGGPVPCEGLLPGLHVLPNLNVRLIQVTSRVRWETRAWRQNFAAQKRMVPRNKSTVWVGVKGLRLMCVRSDVTRNAWMRSLMTPNRALVLCVAVSGSGV